MEEQAIIVDLQLSAPGFGESEERETCTLYMYGPDADKLFAAVEPDLRSSPLTRGGHAVKRYGAAASPESRQVKVDFDPGS